MHVWGRVSYAKSDLESSSTSAQQEDGRLRRNRQDHYESQCPLETNQYRGDNHLKNYDGKRLALYFHGNSEDLESCDAYLSWLALNFVPKRAWCRLRRLWEKLWRARNDRSKHVRRSRHVSALRHARSPAQDQYSHDNLQESRLDSGGVSLLAAQERGIGRTDLDFSAGEWSALSPPLCLRAQRNPEFARRTIRPQPSADFRGAMHDLVHTRRQRCASLA